jgi:hypothetical protein
MGVKIPADFHQTRCQGLGGIVDKAGWIVHEGCIGHSAGILSDEGSGKLRLA